MATWFGSDGPCVEANRKVAWIYGNQVKAEASIHVSLNDTALQALKRQVGNIRLGRLYLETAYRLAGAIGCAHCRNSVYGLGIVRRW